jgi:type VI secretion system ImpC/EvpB family protein
MAVDRGSELSPTAPDPAEAVASSRPPAAIVAPTLLHAALAATGHSEDGASLAAKSSADPTRNRAAVASSIMARFLDATTVREALVALFGELPAVGKSEIAAELNRQAGLLDVAINRQLNAILHHPGFQRLEASWRGLKYLHDCAIAEDDAKVVIRVLSATRRELERDFERAAEFDRSHLFQKVYEAEFGSPGGRPYGVLITDLDMRPFSSPDYPYDDLSILRSLAQVGAAAFCPVIASAHPSIFALDDFSDMDHRLNHAETFERKDYLHWRSLRDAEDSRFLGLVLPRVLMRAPYADDGTRVDRFCFHEDVTGPDRSKHLWGSAAYALGGVLIRAFAAAGWLADIRGVRRDEEGGGIVPPLAQCDFRTDSPGITPRSSTEINVTDDLERQLSDLGFIPLSHCPDTDLAAFYSVPSLQKPKKYDRAVATTNARISALLQHIFCASRFAHYVKVIGRDKIGKLIEAGEIENELQRWITKYVTADSEATRAVKARRPLREANVSVQAVEGKPGAFRCEMHLVPHYELDELATSIQLKTELSPPRTQ